MIRIFKVYYPARTLILLGGEALIVWTSFLLAVLVQHPDDGYVVLNYEGGYLKIFGLTTVALLISHWFDLYDPTHFDVKGELYFRLLLVPGFLSLALAIAGLIFPRIMLGKSSFLLGLIFLTIALLVWRAFYGWLSEKPYFREPVYVLGGGERARRLVLGLRKRSELGADVVGWSGNVQGALNRETMAADLMEMVQQKHVRRVIVAVQDRRDASPMDELLKLRLRGVHIEEATSWLEKISGKIEVEQLYPSWIIYAQGFRFSTPFRLFRRLLAFSVSLVGLLLTLPLMPFVVLAIKLDSSGPVLYRQERVGRGGKPFYCYKFRTMRQDAEADTGPTWALDDDPRITRIGRFLRTSRIDEIPQLWCVLRGDMAFVGPRPERPEFVELLSKQLPYYGVRHMVRPGITGWAQVRYKYGNTIEDAKEKLQYDLFYIKNASLGLDVFIMFQTIKIVVLGRGAQ